MFSYSFVLTISITIFSIRGNTVTENSLMIEEDAIEDLEWWQRNIDKQDPVAIEETRSERRFDVSECNLSPQLKEEISSYKGVIDQIIEASTVGAYRGKTFDELAFFVDSYSSRLSGTETLEDSLTYLEEKMIKLGMVDVHGENATVPQWIRGEEVAYMISPKMKKLDILGLGFSVPTPNNDFMTGEIIVVDSFRDLQRKKDSVKGKILVFSSRTGESGIHCLIGASYGAKLGAIAVLARSPTSFSLYTGHTGVQFYDERYPKIPVASLTVEDADLLTRLYDRGEKIVINLKMENKASSESISRNVIGDMIGRTKPEEFVIVSGHADSWDVGQGVQDDGIGPILALQVVSLLKHLDLHPKRTIRSIAWTGEEAGLFGARQWMRDHRHEMENYSAAMEADYGCLRPAGLLYSGNDETGCILNEILTMLAVTNATKIIQTRGLYTDIYGLAMAGVPGIVLNGDADNRYFWYHHTKADSIQGTSSNSELDLCLAVWASTSYVIADLNEKLPREKTA